MMEVLRHQQLVAVCALYAGVFTRAASVPVRRTLLAFIGLAHAQPAWLSRQAAACGSGVALAAPGPALPSLVASDASAAAMEASRQMSQYRSLANTPSSPAGDLAKLLAEGPPLPWAMRAKDAADRTVAAIALLLLTPLLLLIAIAVRLDSPGPVLFSQHRHGRGGREFAIYKFRTMYSGQADRDGRVQTKRGDCRVTRTGDFLRRTSLDELPQLWNVLNGTMSLVGPRPHPIGMRTEGLLGQEIAADYPERHRVKPGITGLAQINGNRGATETVEQLRARVADDLRYIETWSLLGDLRILLLTPIRLVLHRGNAF